MNKSGYRESWGNYRLILVCVSALMFLGGCQSNPEYASSSNDIKLATNEYVDSPANLYIKLARAYYDRGDNVVALGHAQKAVDRDSGNPNAHNILALIYQRLGQSSKANTGFKRALSISPHDPYINNAYGSFLCTQGDLDKSLIHYNKAYEHPLYKLKEIPLSNAGICALRQGNLEVAEEYLRKALQNNGKFRFALYNMIHVSVLTENFHSARAFLQRYLEVGRHDSKTLWWGIQTENSLGDKDRLASFKLLLKARFADSNEAQLLRKMENNLL